MTNRLTTLSLACALAASASAAATAGPNDILIGLDSKVVYPAEGQTNIKPGADAVLVVDIADHAHPRIRASLPLTNSLLGPPTNLQITPNGRLGLVANSVNNIADGAAWKAAPDDKLFVIDLDSNPPKLLDTVTVGKQPSGLAISRKGDLALIANRAGKSVSVLSIDGATVKLVGDVPMPGEVAAVAITPDGKRAFAVMNLAGKVGVLAIDGQTVTYDKAQDIPASNNPYNVDITPDGTRAIVSSNGSGGLNADPIEIIEATGPHPHVVGLATAGGGAEGLAISPDGKWVATPLLLGTAAKHADYFHVKAGQLVMLAPDG